MGKRDQTHSTDASFFMSKGAPSKYNEETLQKSKEYLASCKKTGEERGILPTMEGLALKLGVDPNAITNWSKNGKYPEFTDFVKELKAEQKNQLINDGLYGGKGVNQAMAIFLLKANHEMIETDRRIIEGQDTLINLNIDGKSDGQNKLYRPSEIPAETN